MTMHNIYTLSTSTSTMITPVGTHSGMDITIQSINDSGHIFIGSDEVSQISYGYRLSPGHAISFELPGRDSLYAIASNPDMRIAVITMGLEAQD